LPLTDCICKKVPFPKLTNDWNEVTCKYCLKLKDNYSQSVQIASEDKEC